MNYLKQKLKRGVKATALLSLLALFQPAGAAVITVETSDSTPFVGDNITLTVGAHSRNDIISAFDFSMFYDDNRFNWVSTTFTDALGMTWDYEFSLPQIINAGALSLLTDDELTLWQFGDSLVLLEMTFTAMSAGTSGFTLLSNELVGSQGQILAPALPDTLFVTVNEQPLQVPAPSTFSLVLLIAVGLCVRKTMQEARS